MTTNTDKQQVFVDAYLVYLDVKKAAGEAGLSYDYARRLVTKPHIRKAIAEGRREQQERTQVTQDMVLEGLLKEANNTQEPGSTRVSAWKALGKHLGMFVDKVEQDGTTRIIVEYPEGDA